MYRTSHGAPILKVEEGGLVGGGLVTPTRNRRRAPPLRSGVALTATDSSCELDPNRAVEYNGN